MITDPYSVLGVPQGGSDDEIKAAYKKLAKKYHPDLNDGSAEAEKKMAEINEAYDMLMKQRPQRQQGAVGLWAGVQPAGLRPGRIRSAGLWRPAGLRQL